METLADWIRQRGPLHPRDAVGWAIRLAKHLESLHQHGVAHGAVSPSCLLVQSATPEQRGVIADVRKVAQSQQFHSPERLRTGQIQPPDDVWAVAGTLFTSLTGAWPFGEQRPEMEQRIPHGVPGLIHYGIQDDRLQAILSAALTPDPSRRTTNVQHLRQQMEHWLGDPGLAARLTALDDDDSAEDDQAATAMVAVGHMAEEARRSEPMAAPAPRPSAQGAPRPAAAPAPPTMPPAPEGQDATVMRELPAHIMALAARAAQGSEPPPAAPAAPTHDDDEGGGATRIAPAPDLAGMLEGIRSPAVPGGFPPPSAPRAPQPPPSHPHSPAAPPSVPGRPNRAIRSTQLGMGMPGASVAGPPPAPAPPAGVAPPPSAPKPLPPAAPPRVPPPPPKQDAPRPGFAPPPVRATSEPPPHDPDEIHTVMHSIDTSAVAAAMKGATSGPVAPAEVARPAPPMPRPQPQAPAPPPPADDDDDDDDGARTMMRDSPAFTGGPLPPLNPSNEWKPAAPPGPAPRFPSPAAGQPPAAPRPPEPTQPIAASGGVSMLIQEALHEAPLPEQGSPDMGMLGQGPAGPFAPPGGGVGGQGAQGFPAFGPPPGAQGSMGQSPPAQSHSAQSHAAQGQGHGGPFQPLSNPGAMVGPFGGDLAGMGDPNAYGQAGLEPPPPLHDGGAYPLVGQPMPPGPMDSVAQAPAPRKGGSSLLIICLLVLVLAATLTFIALKYREQLGIPIPFGI